MGQKVAESFTFSSSSSNLNTNTTSRESPQKTKALDRLKCHHCAGPLSKNMETIQWTVPPLIRDSFSMIGSAVGGTASAFYGLNYGPSCYCLLFSMCWFGRWFCASSCSACIFILSCCVFFIILGSFILTGRELEQIQDILNSL